MWDTNGRKIKRFLVWLTWKNKKSWKKYKKAIEAYIKLLKRQDKEWETKWIKNAKIKAKWKIKKYQIAPYQIKDSLKHKGLEKLEKYMD